MAKAYMYTFSISAKIVFMKVEKNRKNFLFLW